MTDPQSPPIVLTDDDRAALLDAATFLEVRATRAFLRHNAVALLRKLAKTAAPSPSEADAILRELVASSEAIDASLENFTDDDYEVANTRHHAAWTRARTYCESAAPQAGWMPIETAPVRVVIDDGDWHHDPERPYKPENCAVIEPLYAAPVPRQAAQADEAKDAARYRWLRDHLWNQALATVYALPITWRVDYPGEFGKSMDAAIDAAINKESQS